MRKPRTVVDRQEVIEALRRGETPEIIAERVGCACATILKIRKQEGIPFIDRRGRRKGSSKETVEKHQAIKEYRLLGHTSKETAEKFGLTKDTVRRICRGLNIPYTPVNQYTMTGEDMSRYAVKYLQGTDFEYVGGYKGVDHNVTIRCKKCGSVFERSMCTIRKRGNITCTKCKEIADQKKIEEHRAELLERKAVRHEDALKRQAERKALYKEQRKHPCPCCGNITTRPKYCSKKCAIKVAEKANRHTHDARRRARLQDQIVDRDITLEKLFERDGGICWICGMMCDYNDKVVRNKTTIAGNLFPSIDHVKPLSEGGEHSWKNIKLAHRICNTRRYKRSPASKKVS